MKSYMKNALICLFILLIVSSALAQQECDENLSELNEENLSRIFSLSLKAGTDPQVALSAVWNFVLSRYPRGKKLTQLQGQECREVSGTHLDLDYHLDGKPYDPIVMEEGIMDADAYHVVGLTKDKISYVRKKAPYERSVMKEGKESQEIYNLTLVLALMPVLPDQIILKADKLNLCPEETSNITAEIKCGECLMKIKEVSFQSKGPGEVSPLNTSTGRDGIAKTVFQAKEEGETEITAYYYDKFLGIKTAKISIKTESCETWDVNVTYSYTMRDEAYFDSYAVRAVFQDAHAIWREIPSSLKGKTEIPAFLKGETIKLFGMGAQVRPSLLHWESRWCCDDAGNWVSEPPPPIPFDGMLMIGTDLSNPKIVGASVSHELFYRYSDPTEIPLEKFIKARAEGIPFTFVSAYEGKDSAGSDIKEMITYEFIPRKKK